MELSRESTGVTEVVTSYWPSINPHIGDCIRCVTNDTHVIELYDDRVDVKSGPNHCVYHFHKGGSMTTADAPDPFVRVTAGGEQVTFSFLCSKAFNYYFQAVYLGGESIVQAIRSGQDEFGCKIDLH